MRNSAMTAAWIVLIVIWGGLALYIRLIRPLILAKHPYKIEKVISEAKIPILCIFYRMGFKRPAFKPAR